MRTVVAGLVVAGLAIAVFLTWPRTTNEEPIPSATSTVTTATTTTTEVTTSKAVTTTAGSHVVTTVEEAEAILRELWFGWFEGIYNQDEDRIREVVVLEETVKSARESFGTIVEQPTPSSIQVSETEVLRADDDCLAVWTVMSLSGFRTGSSDGLHILRWTGDKWKRLSLWRYREDIWQPDCDSQLS